MLIIMMMMMTSLWSFISILEVTSVFNFECLLFHLLEYGGVLGDIVEVQKFRKVIEDVEGSDVEFVLKISISL